MALTLSTASMDQADQQVPSIHALRIRPPTSGSTVQPIWQQQAVQMPQQRDRTSGRDPQQTGMAFGAFGNSQAVPPPSTFKPNSMHTHAPAASAGLFGRGAGRGGRGGLGGASVFGRSPSATPAIPPPGQAPPAPAATTTNEEQWEEHDDFLVPQGSDTDSSDGEASQVVTPGTLINESPLSISYTVEGQSSIPTDGVAHKVSVAELKFEAKVMHIAVPRVRAQAYLQVRIPSKFYVDQSRRRVDY